MAGNKVNLKRKIVVKYILVTILLSSSVALPAAHYPMDRQHLLNLMNSLLLCGLAVNELHNAPRFQLDDQQPLLRQVQRQRVQQQKYNRKKCNGFDQQYRQNNNNKAARKNCARMNVRVQQPRK